jgi:hypothetical protein
VATRGVNEEELLSNLPEDIQRDIQHHFFRFLDKVLLLTSMQLLAFLLFHFHLGGNAWIQFFYTSCDL